MKKKKLIKIVSLIDKDAAKFIRDNVTHRRCELDNAFTWSHTPQGYEYWENIDGFVEKIKLLIEKSKKK